MKLNKDISIFAKVENVWKDKDWKKIILFLLVMTLVSVTFNILIIKNGGKIEENIPYAVVLIFSPAVTSLIINLIFEKNLHGFGWKWKDTKWQFVSYLTPMLYIVGSYLLTILLGFAKINTEEIEKLGPIGLLMIPTVGLFGVVFQVLGEEIGWRGFLMKNLYKKMSFEKASMITGIVWAMFHYPLLIMGNYNNGATPIWYALFFFTVAIMSANTIINWLYIKSGSLWTAIIFHTVHNSLLNDLNPLIENTSITPYLLTEFGAALAISIFIIALFFKRKVDELPSS